VIFFGKTFKAGWLRPSVIVLLLVALKTALDPRGHFAGRKKFAEPAAP